MCDVLLENILPIQEEINLQTFLFNTDIAASRVYVYEVIKKNKKQNQQKTTTLANKNIGLKTLGMENFERT